jgi:hypothetical protein
VQFGSGYRRRPADCWDVRGVGTRSPDDLGCCCVVRSMARARERLRIGPPGHPPCSSALTGVAFSVGLQIFVIAVFEADHFFEGFDR